MIAAAGHFDRSCQPMYVSHDNAQQLVEQGIEQSDLAWLRRVPIDMIAPPLWSTALWPIRVTTCKTWASVSSTKSFGEQVCAGGKQSTSGNECTGTAYVLAPRDSIMTQ